MSEQQIALTKRALRGFKWSYFSVIVQVLLQLGALSVLAHLLPPKHFGLLGMAYIFTNLAERLGQLGVGPALVQREKISTAHIRVGFSISLGMGLLVYVFIWFAAPSIAIFFSEPELTLVLRVVSATFVLDCIGIVSESLLQRDLRFQALLIADNLGYFIGNGLVAILLALAGFGVWSLVIGAVGTKLVKTAILLSLKPQWVTFRFPRRETLDLVNIGVGFSLVRFLNFCALQGDKFIIGRWLGAAALGIYGRAYQLMTLPATHFGHVLDRVLFPAMSERQGDQKRLGEVYLYGVEIVGLIAMPAGVFLHIAAPEVIGFLFREQWAAVVPVLEILSLGIFFRTCYKNADTLIRALGAVYRHAFRQGIYTCLIVSGALFGSKWGLEGVAIAVLAAVLMNYLIMSRLAISLLNLSWLSLFAAHLPALWVSVWIYFALKFSFVLIRAAELGNFVPLVLGGLISGLVFLVALFFRPSLCKLSVLPWTLENIELNRFSKLGSLARWVIIKLS